MHEAKRKLVVAAAIAFGGLASSAQAQTAYDTGATDTEIKIGNIVPYSGPVSMLGTYGRALAAYFDKINAEGGINGRKIKYISLDDGYNPAKTVEAARRLVEQDEVLMLVSPVGTAQNAAIGAYMNSRKVPHLFVGTGAPRWGDYKKTPWSMGWNPSLLAEGRIYAQHVLQTRPGAKVAILFQNDDYGRDLLRGVTQAFGEKAGAMIVAQQAYEATDPTVDSQLATAKSSGADVFIDLSTPKFTAMAIRRIAELGWKPVHYISYSSHSVASVLAPAGLDNAVGVISSTYLRDPTDPRWKDTPEFAGYTAFMKTYYPGGNVDDFLNAGGYTIGQAVEQVLRQAGDNLTRANIMKQAANLDMTLPMLYPGVRVKTAADDYYPIKQMQPIRFNGRTYEPIGGMLKGQ
ncbi:ABC transporter substrate-binding protein [Chelatococcus reniformis]|uniref:Branched-chain amino acid ABC transporter substrate-binding protein n=1 Tax=Chelatococcus reniformis TaxID=1494448 RepID=A0A916UQ50_9HYPH|nr:ABC transporter substrate-binding protein [Chelatococcus reniformis]GGC82857.1 branched-chain amino acid ABC transporter substrate-binding protein [Chelatococcus reniformis]